MPTATSKITAQGQISVPAEVRRRLGVGPGSTLEWEERDGEMVVRRAKRYSFEDIHKAAFPEGPPKHRTLEELKEGIADYVRERYGPKR
jgi:AbrB family looped-hinge helix DNA binding protein